MFAKKRKKKIMFLFVFQAVFLGCGSMKARAQHGVNNAEGARRRSHHGLLHGDDLLTVDLPQSPGVAFQSSLQATSGLEEKTEQVDDPQSQLQRKTKLRLYTFFLWALFSFFIHEFRSYSARCKHINFVTTQTLNLFCLFLE